MGLLSNYILYNFVLNTVYKEYMVASHKSGHMLLSSSPPGQNGRHFGRRQLQMHFLEWKWQNTDSIFIEICSQISNVWYTSIGSGNGLAPNRRQAIAWTNADPDHWRICAAHGRDVNLAQDRGFIHKGPRVYIPCTYIVLTSIFLSFIMQTLIF